MTDIQLETDRRDSDRQTASRRLIEWDTDRQEGTETESDRQSEAVRMGYRQTGRQRDRDRHTATQRLI